jgi:hypothetical protein
MNLPWIQVQDEAVSRSEALAGMLGIHPHQALGMLVCLWRGALHWGREEDQPTGIVSGQRAVQVIVGWCRWTGEPGVLLQALSDCGFLESTDDGLRVRGMSRYSSAFQQRERARERMQKHRDAERSANVLRTSGEVHPEKENEKKKEKHQKKPSGDTPDPEVQESGFRQLTDSICEAYAHAVGQPYSFSPKHGVAVAKLLKLGVPAELLLAVWAHALKSEEFPKVRDVSGLGQHWNTLLAQFQRPPRRANGYDAVDRPRYR